MVSSNCYPTITRKERSYLIRTKDNVVYRKTQVHLKPYTPEKKIEPPELCKKDNEQSLDNNQCINNEQSLVNNGSIKINLRPKHNIKLPNRLDI